MPATLHPWDALGEFSGANWRSRGRPQGSKNLTLRCKINNFDEIDVEAKNDAFSHFRHPCKPSWSPLERKTAPCDFTKSSPRCACGATGLQKRPFYDVFLMFFTSGSKFKKKLRRNELHLKFIESLFKLATKKQ